MAGVGAFMNPGAFMRPTPSRVAATPFPTYGALVGEATLATGAGFFHTMPRNYRTGFFNAVVGSIPFAFYATAKPEFLSQSQLLEILADGGNSPGLGVKPPYTGG